MGHTLQASDLELTTFLNIASVLPAATRGTLPLKRDLSTGFTRFSGSISEALRWDSPRETRLLPWFRRRPCTHTAELCRRQQRQGTRATDAKSLLQVRQRQLQPLPLEAQSFAKDLSLSRSWKAYTIGMPKTDRTPKNAICQTTFVRRNFFGSLRALNPKLPILRTPTY